ncbi:dsDNA nuclease domain-containing protein [Pseudomonas sp. SJZ080]|uniref:dsDNA nuclease domain-containing protein n=1 Tax=Pseudomonas sp. SJZ080 TaxID=2572888 RepID=UPI003531A341
MADDKLPKSAISSWSGFVYQGKVALYHCLKLMESGDEDFELQLDSTDDFAIYKNGCLISAHQVKAKVGKNRSSYIDALKKSGAIEFDRKKILFAISIPQSNWTTCPTSRPPAEKL